MIRGILFDLDGTLVQTEKLKALSYARAAKELLPERVNETQAVEMFKEVVGLSRREVAKFLLNALNLNEAAKSKMNEYDVPTPWQAYVQIRLKIYEKLVADPDVLNTYKCPYNTALLEWAKKQNYRTGLATMSYCQQATRIVKNLNLTNKIDFMATQDDVENGKPDPEIYHLVAKELELQPEECLVIEDSGSGIKAALNAGMKCIAVTNEFTRKKVHESNLLSESFIVDDLSRLQSVAESVIGEIN